MEKWAYEAKLFVFCRCCPSQKIIQSAFLIKRPTPEKVFTFGDLCRWQAEGRQIFLIEPQYRVIFISQMSFYLTQFHLNLKKEVSNFCVIKWLNTLGLIESQTNSAETCPSITVRAPLRISTFIDVIFGHLFRTQFGAVTTFKKWAGSER